MWGTYTFVLRHWSVQPFDALIVIGVSWGVLFLPPHFAMRRVTALGAPVSAILLQAFYQSVLVEIAAALLFATAVKKIGSSAVAALTPTMPALATIFALVFIRENATYVQ